MNIGRHTSSRQAMTLLELVITLTLVGIVGAALVPYFGTALEQSAAPTSVLSQSLVLSQAMGRIAGDASTTYSGDLPGLKTAVGAEGTSQNNGYGNYTVTANRYIVFTAGTEVTAVPPVDPEDLLRVTISDSTGLELTALFK